MTDDLCSLGAAEALARFRDHSLSPVELMRAVIRRAEAVEPRINAFSFTYFERALAAAKASEARYMKPGARLRPLEGIPLAVKDEAQIKGEVTTNASMLWKDGPGEPRTSYAIDRLLKAGAIVHARSTTPEFSCASITHSLLHGVTRNPWNTDFTPGGSSGGSGAALAACSATLASGSDIAGSIRIPASACGVVGFKPPYGRNPQEPPYNFDTYCHIGPMARSVEDCALMQNVMAGPHPGDITTLRPRLRIPSSHRDVRGLKVAVSLDLGFYPVDPAVADNFQRMVALLGELGIEVTEFRPGWDWHCLEAAWDHLCHLWGATTGPLYTRRDEMTGYARDFVERARGHSAEKFLHSMVVAGKMYDELGAALQKNHALLCPTLALPAVAADHDPLQPVTVDGETVEGNIGWCMTWPFNMLSRCPVISLPSGQAGNGVPTGVQIVGRTYDDRTVFALADALEKARGPMAFPTLA